MATNGVAMPPVLPAEKTKPAYANAETMAKAQRSISVSEFFAKNRHLLGFDNPRKGFAHDRQGGRRQLAGRLRRSRHPAQGRDSDRATRRGVYKVVVQDNGPGIVPAQIPNVFGKLLYGSKFHRLRMSRGQQGIGISAAGMYGLLTTGKPVKITSRIGRQGQGELLRAPDRHAEQQAGHHGRTDRRLGPAPRHAR